MDTSYEGVVSFVSKSPKLTAMGIRHQSEIKIKITIRMNTLHSAMKVMQK